jgi:hypothetical protein
MSEIKDFFAIAEQAAKGDFKKELALFLEGLGNEFLRIIQDEIVRRQVMDSRLLLASFEKDAESNVWRLEEDSLTLEVGSSVEYAKYVNDGHWKNPKGVDRRFVPGYWDGDRFIYDPSAKTGMVLKQSWVQGKPYFDSALRILDKMYPSLLETKLQEWLDSYF